MATKAHLYNSMKLYLRLSSIPREYLIVKKYLDNSKFYYFEGRLPDSWQGIFGKHLGEDFTWPKGSSVAVEDETSCVFLWNLACDNLDGLSSIGFLSVESLDLTNGFFPFSIHCSETAEMVNGILCHFGFIRKLLFNPMNERNGSYGHIELCSTYALEPTTGKKHISHINVALLNDLYRHLSDSFWQPYDERQQFQYDSHMQSKLMKNIVTAIQQYAVLK